MQNPQRQADLSAINGRFERRRCPQCLSGQYVTVDGAPEIRKCTQCNRSFNLKLEGVRPKADRRQHKTVTMGEPVAGGAYAIAGKIEIHGVVWRFPAFNQHGRRSH